MTCKCNSTLCRSGWEYYTPKKNGPSQDNLLVIVLLERVMFSEVLNSVYSFCRLLFLSLRTVHISRWSSLHVEALGLPDPFFLAILPVVSKCWPILLIADREIGISSAFRVFVNFRIATVGLMKTSYWQQPLHDILLVLEQIFLLPYLYAYCRSIQVSLSLIGCMMCGR